jgi:hypothetical protein
MTFAKSIIKYQGIQIEAIKIVANAKKNSTQRVGWNGLEQEGRVFPASQGFGS